MPYKKRPINDESKYTLDDMVRLTGYSEKSIYRLIEQKFARKSPARGRFSENQLQDILKYKEGDRSRKGRKTGEYRSHQTFRVRPKVMDIILKRRDAGDYHTRDAAVEDMIMHSEVCETFTPGAVSIDAEGQVTEIDLSGL